MVLTGKTQEAIDMERIALEKAKRIKEYQEYLDTTDWYVIRLMERNVNIPEDVLLLRNEAVVKINELRA